MQNYMKIQIYNKISETNTLQILSNVFVTYSEIRVDNDVAGYRINCIKTKYNNIYYVYHTDFINKEYIEFNGTKNKVYQLFSSIMKLIDFVMKKLDRLYYIKNDYYYNVFNNMCSLTNYYHVIANSKFNEYDYKIINNYFHITTRGENVHAKQKHLTLIPKNEYKEYISHNRNKTLIFLVKHNVMLRL